jgi:hypothetical protein
MLFVSGFCLEARNLGCGLAYAPLGESVSLLVPLNNPIFIYTRI